jgi:hypothetical protein
VQEVSVSDTARHAYSETILPGMTDPSDALPSFQAALASGQMRLQPGALDPDIYLHVYLLSR